MDSFTTHTGVGVPLRRSNVDTDQIIPAVYLKRVTRTGFEDGLFAAWRGDPDFVLNDPTYAEGSVPKSGPATSTEPPAYASLLRTNPGSLRHAANRPSSNPVRVTRLR